MGIHIAYRKYRDNTFGERVQEEIIFGEVPINLEIRLHRNQEIEYTQRDFPDLNMGLLAKRSLPSKFKMFYYQGNGLGGYFPEWSKGYQKDTAREIYDALVNNLEIIPEVGEKLFLNIFK